MRTHMCRFACSSLLAGAVAVGLGSSANSVPLLDGYIGGMTPSATDSATWHNADVIGKPYVFGIDQAIVTRSGPGNNTLNITIQTWYAGAPGDPSAFGTNYGSLFLSTGSWSVANPGTSDTYSSHVGFWDYAVTTTGN